MTRQHNLSMSLLNSLCIVGLSMSFILTAASPAQAGIFNRIREIFRPSSQLGSASGTSRGGGSRNICQDSTAVDTNSVNNLNIAAEDDVTTIELNETSLASLVAFVPSIVEEHPEFGKREVLVAGRTLEAYPRLSMYVPFSKSADSAILKFSISDISDKETPEYVAGPFDLALPEKPGFVIIQMMSTLDGNAQIEEAQSEEPRFTGLEPDILYEWTVTLHCNTKDSSSSLQSVSGLISLASDSELSSSELTDYNEYLDEAIWYEMVTQLIATKDEDPTQWSEFLSLYGLQDDIADQEVISIVVPTMATIHCAK